MPNNQAHDPRVATAGERVAVSRTLQVAVKAASVPVVGQLFFTDNFSNYETDPSEWDNIELSNQSGSPNYNTLLAKGIRCNNSIRCTPRLISDIAGPSASQQVITESVETVVNPKIGSVNEETALRFRMNAVPLGGGQSYAEFDWSLVEGEFYPEGEGTDEIWVQYDMYVPENYHLRDASEGTGFTGYDTEHKINVLYCGSYTGIYPTLIVGGGPYAQDFGMPQENTMYLGYSLGGSENEEGRWTGKDRGEVLPFIYGDFDPGHWMRVTLHMKLPSAIDVDDGLLDLVVQRHVGEADTYTDILLQETAVPGYAMYEDYARFITGGYILGTYNTGYDEDVNYLVDNLIISDAPENLADFSLSQPATPQNRVTYSESYSEGAVANIRRPGGMVDGDTLVMVILGRANKLYSDLSFINGDGAGFSSIYNSREWDSTSRDAQCAVFVKTVEDAINEPLWYEVDFSGKFGSWEVICIARSGRGDCVNNSLIKETIPAGPSTQTSPISIDLAGVTAREGDDILWIGAAVMETFQNGTITRDSLSFPVGMTPLYQSVTPRETFGIAVSSDVSAGATGTLSGSFTLTDNTLAGVPRGIIVALPKEAA